MVTLESLEYTSHAVVPRCILFGRIFPLTLIPRVLSFPSPGARARARERTRDQRLPGSNSLTLFLSRGREEENRGNEVAAWSAPFSSPEPPVPRPRRWAKRGHRRLWVRE